MEMKKHYHRAFCGLVSVLALSGCQSNDAYLYQLNALPDIEDITIVNEQFLKENGKLIAQDNFVYRGILQDGNKRHYLGLRNKANPQKYDTYPAVILDGLSVIIDPISKNELEYYITKATVLSFKDVLNGELFYQIPEYNRINEHRIAGKFIKIDDTHFVVIH